MLSCLISRSVHLCENLDLNHLTSGFAEMEATVINIWSKNHIGFLKNVKFCLYYFIFPINTAPINTQHVQYQFQLSWIFCQFSVIEHSSFMYLY